MRAPITMTVDMWEAHYACPDAIYISHSGGRRANPDWWVVTRGGHADVLDEVRALLGRNRRVLAFVPDARSTLRELLP